VPQWGNHHKLGHSWIYTKYGDEDYSTSTSGSDNLKERYKNESIPKVNRSSYAYQDSLSLLPLTKDVTHKYVQTLNPSIENVFDVPISQPIICIFNRKRTWNPIDTGIFDPNKNTVSYKNIGSNVLYLAATIEDKTLTPINNPFFIDNNQNIHFFKPTEHIQDSVIITRKYGASSPRYTKKRDWATSLDGSCFMASNDLNFKNADTLFKITKHNSTHAKKVVSLTKKKYKYLEFKSKKGVSNIIQMLFQDKNNTQLNATFIEKNGEDLSQNNTSFSGVFKYYESTFSNFKIKFDKKVSIDNAIIQTRNDGNHIMIGNKYQLFYWDKEWQSLGVKKANDTVLYYNTPKNALLRLRFIGDGYEEHVFTIDENKKQKWLGFHNQ